MLKVNLHTPKYLYYNLQPYKFKNILVIPCSNEIFAVDLRTGAIIWRTIDDYSGEDFLEGINQFFFRTYYDYKTKKYLIKKININSGHAEIILEQTHKADVKIHCRTPIPVVNNGDTLLFYTCIQQKIESKRTIPFFNIYSQNKKMIIYSDSLKTNFLGQGITKQPMIYENSIILINDNQIVEFDIKSSSIKSNISLPRDMLTSKPLIQDGMLYYPCEDGFLYAIKLNDNNIKWKTKISGTPGHIKISEDKIFVVGGGDGLLHCIDIKNGQLKFSIPEKKSASLFERPLLLINKNKILLSDKNKFYFYQINE